MSADLAFKGTRALVIDSDKTLLDCTVRQLVDLGVSEVLTCRDMGKARAVLEKQSCDFVLCADEITGSALRGQALLEELRRDSVLPHTTVFVMISSKATYLSVMEAAEAALDCLLLRPFRTSELYDRLIAARHRRAELRAVFEALNREDLKTAIALCLKHQSAGGPYAQLCGRMAAELMLKSDQAPEALALFRGFDASAPASWSGLGAARALMAMGEIGATRREVTALLERHPNLPDAQELLGRALLEQGDLAGALGAFERALQATPYCMLRLQHAGTLALYQKKADLALQWLERARSMDKHSRLFDAMTLMLLAMLHVDRQDAKSVAVVLEALKQYQTRFPNSARIKRLTDATTALLALAQGRLDEALTLTQSLADQLATPDSDLEVASIVLSLWVRLPDRELSAGVQQQVVRAIAMRFCVSRAATAVLLAIAAPSDAVCNMIRECQADISRLAEAALQQALLGQPGPAIAQLLSQGNATGNARLITLASHLLKRHAAELANGQALTAQATAMQAQHCRPMAPMAGLRRTGRAAGGMVMRAKPMAPATELAPLVQSADSDDLVAAAEPNQDAGVEWVTPG